jgi:MATE family multidrug resistance protein
MTEETAKPLFTGRMTEVVLLFIPIAFMTLSGNLVSFLDKLFFARLSPEAIEAGLSVTNICRVFQMPCLSIAAMAKVFVGTQQGAGQQKSIGVYIWQFIWFSLLSMIVTVPLSLLYGTYYFQSTVIEAIAMPYFYFLVAINFLYPLGASLSCFYIGRGRTRYVLAATLGSQILNLCFAYLLIFGVKGWVPSLGLLGGAIGVLVGQGCFCLLLFSDFLSHRYAQLYGTRQWRLDLKLFWECICPGLLRSVYRISVFLCWASVGYLMVAKGDNYLLVWSIGGTMTLFLPFIGEAMCQALTTISSNLIGSRSYDLLAKVSQIGFCLVMGIITVMAIPLIGFPEGTFHLLFPGLQMNGDAIRSLFFGLWLAFSFWTLAVIPISRLLAFKDAKFLLYTGSLSWVTCFLLMLIAVNVIGVPAESCWIVLSLYNLTELILFSWRASYWKRHETMLRV